MKRHIGCLAGSILRLLRLHLEDPFRVVPVDVAGYFTGDLWLVKHFTDQSLPFSFLVDDIYVQSRDLCPDSTLGHGVLVSSGERARR